MTAFAFEAYLNHAGAATFKCWDEVERLSPWSKFALLCEQLGVSFPMGAGGRPVQTVTKLLNFRNTMAHGRSQKLSSKDIECTTDNYQAELDERLLSDWEKLVQTGTFAKLCREDVGAVIGRMHDARPQPKEHLFTLGMGTARAALHSGPEALPQRGRR